MGIAGERRASAPSAVASRAAPETTNVAVARPSKSSLGVVVTSRSTLAIRQARSKAFGRKERKISRKVPAIGRGGGIQYIHFVAGRLLEGEGAGIFELCSSCRSSSVDG